MSLRTSRLFAGIAAVAVCALLASQAMAQTVNQPPVISGTMPNTATVGVLYSFTPTVRDPDTTNLVFRLQNRPAWASFNTRTGRIYGTPGPNHVGKWHSVKIFVYDGRNTRSLLATTIQVKAAPTTPTPPPPPPPSANTLAEKYPGDVNIASDPAVIFHDPYEDSAPSSLGGRYNEIKNPGGVSMVSDRPSKSRGARSVRLTAGAVGTATHLYKKFNTGYDEVYLRYYTKYVGSNWGHSGFWFGGYNPALNYPYPRAGQKPTGSDRFSFGLEPQPSGLMDMYTYWRGMRSHKTNPVAGDYYGNLFIEDSDLKLRTNEWVCYEVHLKLNPDPATGQDAVFELWENDQLVRRYDNTGPYGFWTKDKFCPADSTTAQCAPFRPSNPAQVLLDQRWRTTTALKFNHIWPQNYNTSSTNSSLLYDDLVVARSRIGCLR